MGDFEKSYSLFIEIASSFKKDSTAYSICYSDNNRDGRGSIDLVEHIL